MGHGSGQADGGRPHLQPSAAIKRQAIMQDALQAKLKPTVQLAGKLDQLCYQLEIALLTSPSTPDGTAWVELSAPGYKRQTSRVSGSEGAALSAEAEIRFSFDEQVAPQVCQVAAFLGERLIAYGLASPTSNPRQSGTSIIIKAQNLTLARA